MLVKLHQCYEDQHVFKDGLVLYMLSKKSVLASNGSIC